MISKEIIEKLMPGLQEIVPEEDWAIIPNFFEKVYRLKYNEEHDAYILNIWDDDLPALAFDMEDYKFLGVVTEEFAVEHGDPI